MTTPQPGDRIELVALGVPDPYTNVRAGSQGTVKHVNDLPAIMGGSQVFVHWDDGSTLALLPEYGDDYRTLPPGGC